MPVVQNVGVGVIGTARIGTTALVLIFDEINHPVVEDVIDVFTVVRTQNG